MYPEDGNASCYQLEDNSYWFRHRNECIVAMIQRFPPKGAILDVGGGNGYVTRGILMAGYAAALLEPGKVGAANAKHVRGIPEVINATFEDADFPPESLSAVGLFDVLEHIRDDTNFLKAIWNTLKPDGLIYVTVPAHQYLWSESDVYAEHFRRYNQQMASVLVDRYFDLLYFTYFFGALIIPILLLRTLPFKLQPGKQKSPISNSSEHGISGGPIVSFLSILLRKELSSIQMGKHLRSGSSCLWVLQKKNDPDSL